jgi:hypothetical protein
MEQVIKKKSLSEDSIPKGRMPLGFLTKQDILKFNCLIGFSLAALAHINSHFKAACLF